MEVRTVPAMPTDAQYLDYFDSLSNWGRWGDDDRLGTLNLITAEKRAAAGRLIQDGSIVSLSRDMDPDVPDPLARGTVLQRFMQTHETDEIARSIGIVTRGVLLDIPALSGRRWLDPGEAVFPEQLEEAEARQHVRVEAGDVVLLYTGNFARIAEEGLHPQLHHPGYAAACLPWLHDRGVALISSDNINDVNPSGFEAPDLLIPVHCVALVAMGLWMVDNMELDDLAAACTAHDRWEFFFSMLPWRLVGVTASPVNPVAIF
jgi:kynurenine formamidase